jgi:type IV pilus assembly protein PilP
MSPSFRPFARRVLNATMLLAAVGLSACSSEQSDLEQWVNEVKARKSNKIEPIPQIRQYEAFAYDPADRRDPFAPVEPQKQTSSSSDGPKPDLDRNREPLEEFPLDALAMVGTIQKGSMEYALIRAPDGVVHRVIVGNHLGQNYGQIQRISEFEVTISEIVPDGFGGWVQRPASLALTE